jgi:hypothetical protein
MRAWISAPLAVFALAGAVALGGCGSTDTSTPVACLEGEGTFQRALRAAPGAVKLAGETPISGCLIENQSEGELASVGTAMVTAATKLNAEARKQPGGAANLQLGYLLGAAERGAETTDGIHTELIRRLSVAARYSPDNRPLPHAFLKTYESGYAAGVKDG